MKSRTFFAAMIASMSIASSCFSADFCVLQAGGGPVSCSTKTLCALKASDGGGCKDLGTGKVFVQRGNKLIDPGTNSVYMELSESKITTPVMRGRVQYEYVHDVEYVVRQPAKVAKEDDTDAQQGSGASTRRSSAGNRIASPPPAGAIDVRTGEYYPGAAGGVINPKNGQFYPDVGAGYIDPRTGAFMPKH